ncbi:HD domain-containing phosphohydrolase [Chitinilyticum piscinae]|uniref:HD domain-containing protein n=1 Tax=Chitinilyticum piscinae TaxID=2866724 RepID=A0A8J7K1N3_9NEIS|nr:HD domain-containing phosphohydrolase [Chitinilyticum piscinae]MBE9609461.1 HD domain-containing protein [Chitinilyticum piscinae]
MNTLLNHLLKSLHTVALLVEARDAYTGGHLWRVSQFARLMAEDGGLDDHETARITLGGFLHDFGKIAVPDAILNKSGRLSDDEYTIMKTHPGIGERMIAQHPLAPLIRGAIAWHHERIDGQGYPYQLQGDAIPLDARIVSLADAFDAMTSNRPYRRGMSIDDALQEISRHLGSQFDAEWGERLIRLGRTGKLHHIVSHSEPGIPLQHCPNCGPTVTLSRRARSGDRAWCPACHGELRVLGRDGDWLLSATGRKLDYQAPQIDEELIGELTRAVGDKLNLRILEAIGIPL